MYVTLSQAKLAAAIETATRFVTGRSTIPIHRNIQLCAGSGTLAVSGFDDGLRIDARTGAEIVSEGLLTVPADAMRKFAKVKFSASANVSIQGHDGFATLTVDHCRFRLPTLPAHDFPAPENHGDACAFAVEARLLRGHLHNVANAMSRDETRFYLNGVCMWTDGLEIVFSATDGFRLAESRMPAPSPTRQMSPSIIPRATIYELLRNLDVAEDCFCRIGNKWVSFDLKDKSITSTLVDGIFPHTPSVIPRDNDKLFRMRSSELRTSIARVTKLATERGHPIKFEFGWDGSCIRIETSQNIEAVEELKGNYNSSERLTAYFDSRLLMEILSSISGEIVTMALSTAKFSALITSDDHPEATFVLMQKKVNAS